MSLFRARVDINIVNDYPDGITWEVMGVLVDLTGSFTALDISVGDKIICRGYTANSTMVYDRYRVTEIIGRNAENFQVLVQMDSSAMPQANTGRPGTGSFPIGSSPWYEHLTVKASHYQNQFDPDYDAAIDNLNLSELTNILMSWSGNSQIGGHHCYASILERDNIPPGLRMWGMHVSVWNDPVNGFDNGNYELIYNLFNTTITDNRNWRRLDKNIIRVDTLSSGIVQADVHKLGIPNPCFYAGDLTAPENGFFLTQLSYQIDEEGTITWNASKPISGYLILI